MATGYSLRLQVTGGCQLRCGYCRPDLRRADPSARSPAELARLVAILAGAGVRRVRITGGEPLLRPEVVEIVDRLARIGGLEEITLTTNGQRLAALASPLRQAGLSRVNVHIDSLVPERYRRICGGRLEPALEGLRAALAEGLSPKVNAVVLRGENEDELPAFCALAGELGVQVRFIELMDTGVAPAYAARHGLPAREVRARLEALGARCVGRRGSAPAVEYRLGEAKLGLVASETEPFCDRCDRLRLSADGTLRTCLYAGTGVALGALARQGASDAALLEVARAAIAAKRSFHPCAVAAAPRPSFSMAAIGG